jgi:CMP-N,N'-diacetyllegionaminic acid synthase
MENNEMEILGLIPARAGSKGIPNKNMSLLAGKPLIEYTFEAAKKSKRLTRTILSTDSPEIADLASIHQIEVPFLRPIELAKDDTGIILVIQHALAWLAQEENYSPIIVVLLQPTSPLRNGKHIDEAVDLLVSSNSDSVVSVMTVPGYYNPHWQFLIENEYLSIFTKESFSSLIPQRQKLPQTYTRNGAIYTFWNKTLMQTDSIYGIFCRPYIMSTSESINIDSIDDLHYAENIIKSKFIKTSK